MIWCEKILEEEIFDIGDEDNSLSEIIILFDRVYILVHIDNEHTGKFHYGLQNHVYNNLLHVDEKEYFSISVFKLLQLSTRHPFFIL